MMKLVEILAIMVGGSLGALSRYHAGVLITRRFPEPPIPLAMMIINVAGSFVLGFLLGWDIQSRLALDILATGYLGAFTTFSTFSVEAIQLWENKYYKKFAAYIVTTIILCVMGFLVGFQLVHSIF